MTYAVIEGEVTLKPANVGTITVSAASDSASVEILGANEERVGILIFNDSDQDMFVKLGATASTSDFSFKISRMGYWEPPNNYLGVIHAIWDFEVTGNARVTELT